jgi:hypothetical protein
MNQKYFFISGEQKIICEMRKNKKQSSQTQLKSTQNRATCNGIKKKTARHQTWVEK